MTGGREALLLEWRKPHSRVGKAGAGQCVEPDEVAVSRKGILDIAPCKEVESQHEHDEHETSQAIGPIAEGDRDGPDDSIPPLQAEWSRPGIAG